MKREKRGGEKREKERERNTDGVGGGWESVMNQGKS